MTIEWTDEARLSLLRTLAYWTIRNSSNEYSLKVSKAIDASLNLLLAFPQIGQPISYRGIEAYRYLILKKFAIIYTIQSESLKVITFFSTNQNIDYSI